jgi:hypothetical protein
VEMLILVSSVVIIYVQIAIVFIIILQQGILCLDAKLVICFVGFRELNFNVIIVLKRKTRSDINAKSAISMCA